MKKVTILLLLLASCSPHKDEEIVTFAINPWFPYEIYNEEDKRIEGATGEYVDLIFKELGFKSDFIIEPDFARAQYLVATGQVDAIYTILETEERKEHMLFSNSIITPYDNVFYINKYENPQYENADIYNFDDIIIFGSLNGEVGAGIVVNLKPNIKFIRNFEKYQDLMFGLDKSIIDVAVLEKYNGIYEYNEYIKSNPKSTFELGQTSNTLRQDLKIAFQKSDRGEYLKSKFDMKNEELRATDVLQRLFEKYVGKL